MSNSTKQTTSQNASKVPPPKLDELFKKGRPVLPPMNPETVVKRERPHTVTTIKHISKSVPIEIIPPEIIINDIEPNQTYEVVVLVRNLTATGRRIRIYQPKTNKFRCDYDMQGNIAPGLSMKLLVSFETDKNGDFHDALEIVSEDRFNAIVPLHAYQPQSMLYFDPFVNFGFVKVQKEEIKTITFRNDGRKDGKVELRLGSNSDLVLQPKSFSIAPGSTYDVKLCYKPKEAGILRDNIEVIVEGQSILKHIDVSATSVEYYIFLVDSRGAQNNNFDFGDIYFGQFREIEAFLVNNSPQKFHFKSKFLTGIQSNNEEVPNLQTPNELGLEQIQRVMTCTPSEGIIDSYTQVPIKFHCQSRVSEEMIFWTRNFCMKKEKGELDDGEDTYTAKFDPRLYNYTCIFEFNGQTDLSPYIHLSAQGICPTVKVSDHIISFGECQVNDRKDFIVTLENKNDDHAVDYAFSNVAHFKVTPKRARLLPHDSQSIIFTFEPKNIGRFTSYIDLELFGAYKIPIKLMGSALSIAKKKTTKKGTESLPEDFKPQYQFMEADNPEKGIKRIQKGDRLIFQNVESSENVNLPQLEGTDVSDKLNLLYAQKNNKTKYNNFLKEQRQKRLESRQKREIDEKANVSPEKLEHLVPNKEFWLPRDKEDKKLYHPMDYEFHFGNNPVPSDEPKYSLPSPHDPLFVTKPIGPYEPAITEKMDTFKPDPTRPFKVIFPSEPKSQAEIRDTSRELTPDELQRIFAGPTTIDFGSIYVKSKVSRYFSIQNQLRTPVLAQIEWSNDELQYSYSAAQVIPSAQTAGFEVAFYSQNLQTFKGFVKYIINGKHEFKFTVLAKVEPVKLQLSTQSLPFRFQEKDEEMEMTSTIKVENKGNAKAFFNWKPSSTGIFKIQPMQGEVPADGSTPVSITYIPSGTNFKGESERLVMNVTDGDPQFLTCMGYVNEARCDFKETMLDFEQVLVGNEQTKTVYLKNKHKTTAVFQMNWRLPAGISVQPTKGRIPPDGIQELKVTFKLDEPMVVTGELVASVRGGKPAKLAIKGETIVPQVRVVEDEFDFGGVTFGSTATLKMTIVNDSNIAAILDTDLSEGDAQYLEIVPAQEHGEDESSFLQSFDAENANLEDLEARDISAASEESDEEEEQKEETRKFSIKVKKKSVVNLLLKFKPEDARSYHFELPLVLRGYGRTEGTTRVVSCRGIKPKCIIQPSIVDFKKKIISNFEKPAPMETEIEVDNMDHHKSLIWQIDSKLLAEENIFTINPSKGRIEPGQRQVIRVGFNPLNPGGYEKTVPFYLDNDTSKPYAEIVLKGYGDYPKLLFERREVILPVVPLDIESRCTFRIINDGYENLTLKYEILNDVGNLPIKLEFPEGKTLGVTKPKLKVDVVFKSHKPLSLTTEVQFIDDNKHTYKIRLSATADNSLLSNFPYIQRSAGEFQIVADPGKPIRIKEIDSDESETSRRAVSVGVSKSGSIARTARSLLGYAPIPFRELERACENLKNWLNQNVLTTYLSKFPQDVLESNGAQLFELITYLTGKAPPGKAVLTGVTKKAEKVQILHKQYDDLIRSLKENGALLNTIRPEYLLKSHEYNLYSKANAGSTLLPSMIKLSENKFAYLSTDAWITMFYQILKIYYLSRLTPRVFRNTLGMPAERPTIPDSFLEGSNFLSVSENLLLKWMEIHYEKMRPGNPRVLKNFDEDLRDGQVFSAVIQSYVGTNASKALPSMRLNPQSKEDYVYNAERIIMALGDIGLVTHLTPKDLETPRQREMVIFCLYLYNNLPHYIPKEFIEFKCTLRDEVVKNIVLTNPSAKPINYRVRLEGDSDFTLMHKGSEEPNEGYVHLNPKERYEFPVKFSARLSKPMSARVFFTNKREEGHTQAAALVFDLVSKVVGRRSEIVEVFETKLYEIKNRDIKVENIFNSKADFVVELIHQKNQPEEPEDKKKKKKKPAASQRGAKAEPEMEEEKGDTFLLPFSTKITTLTVAKGGSATLPVQFLPFLMDTQTCYLVFRDDKVGEMQYTLQGKVDLPSPIEVTPPPPTFYLENEMVFTVPILLQNPNLLNARRLHIERLPQLYKVREQEKEKAIKQMEKAMEFITFDIESYSQYLNLPTQFTIQNPSVKKGVKQETTTVDKKPGQLLAQPTKKKMMDTSFESKTDMFASMVNMTGSKIDNKLQVSLNFKVPTKDHPLKFLLKSQNKMDIRLYEVKVSVLPKPVKAVLEMRCPARESLIQDIPIKNETDRDWQVRAQLIPDTAKNGQCFTGLKEIRIPKNSVGNYQVKFWPPWILQAEARLVLNNPSTGQQYEFDLKGIGEEPLAEGHVILECKARKTKTHVFTIRNDSEKKMTYRVETDLYNASGKSTFELGPNRSEDYVLEVTPVLGGAYTGSITFYDEEEKYKWWTVEVHTESPRAEKIIDLATTIRKAIAFDISISNPLDERVTFEVILNGEGLLGETAFTIMPKQTATYELVYSPLKAAKQTGSIAFIHEKLGEVWYDLNLEANDAVAVRLSTLKAELGKVESHEVELENPSNKEVHVKTKLSNPHNFNVMPDDIVIPPYDSAIVQIQYMPSDLDIMETCEVIFETEEIGNWVFLAFGQGIPPTTFGLQVIAGALNRDVSAIINYKNPFKDAITVQIDLVGSEESHQVFKILLKKMRMTIGGMNSVQIPISFLPRTINDYYAEVVVSMNEKIRWRYPIKGVTESFSNTSDFYLKTKCRLKTESELNITLPGNPSLSPQDVYTLELANIPPEFEKILNNPAHKAISFNPIKNTLNDPSESLCFKATFQPLKPFKTAVELVIIKSTGGRWKFKLHLEATFPDPDDAILITSSIHKTSSVSFKLTNYNKFSAEFVAGFTAESDTEFTVTPKTGILEPYKQDVEGTTFIVSFTPTEYGKVKTAKLIIQTDEMLWSFNVKGDFPKYVAPRIQSARIENKLPTDLARKLARKPNKNFLVENIKKSSHSPPKQRGKVRSRSGSRSASPEAMSIADKSRDDPRDRKRGGMTAGSFNQLK